MIPILDLKAQYAGIKREIDAAVEGVLASGTFIMGPNVEAFEEEIASYLGVEHAISLNSGTDALHLALRALNIGPGDEVITSPFTFAATTEAIGIVGATVVFADIEPETYNIDPRKIERAITARTRAIIPVHLYGLPADMIAICNIARRHKLAIVEDCAQAIGAKIGDRKVGTFGDVGCFSFFPSKNLGAYGDGGLVTTDDSDLADRLRALRVHGAFRKYHHDELGINSRLDELQAAILRVKLPHLDEWIDARRRLADTYTSNLFEDKRLTLPLAPAGSTHVYHQYTIRLPNRDAARRRLAAVGIQTMVYYPVPLHLQRSFKSDQSSRFPRSEEASREVLSLPMYPELSIADQNKVVNELQLVISDIVESTV